MGKWVKVMDRHSVHTFPKSVNVKTMNWMMLFFVFLLEFLPDFIHACTSRYQEELQYLDYYLGIQPENQGILPVEGTTVILNLNPFFKCRKEN